MEFLAPGFDLARHGMLALIHQQIILTLSVPPSRHYAFTITQEERGKEKKREKEGRKEKEMSFF